MIGLKRGVVRLENHDENWKSLSNDTIIILHELFKEIAIDIQHVGSTAIEHIHAKPIIDLVVGVENLEDVNHLNPSLESNHIISRPQDIPEQLLYVMEDSEHEIRTHHIHVVVYNGKNWHNYINFRDYLKANPTKAKEYEALKIELANKYPLDRSAYTSGKDLLITKLLDEAAEWKRNN